MKHTKLVEFLGLPGSGKTTTANKIVPTLRDGGHRLRVYREVMVPLKERPLRKIILGARLLSFVVRYRVAVIALLRLVWSLDHRPLKTYKSAVRVLQEALFIELAAGRAETDTIFLDQGLYQSLWYVVTYSHSFDSAAFEAVLDGLGPLLPSIVVGVRATPEQACKGVVARRKFAELRARSGVECPFDSMPPSVTLTVFRRQVGVLDEYLPGMARERGAAVTQVEANLHESEVRDLTRWISLHLAAEPAQEAAREKATEAEERTLMTLPLDERRPD